MTHRDVLAVGTLEVEGRLIDASNATLKCVAELDGISIRCVYKPIRGERPLWDFPSGSLGFREVAAYDVSQSLGWDLVPLTVWRESGPYGPGMCQEWIEEDADRPAVGVWDEDSVPVGWRVVAGGEGHRGQSVSLAHEDSLALRRMAILDVLLNNADRKGGHILRSTDGRVLGIDHGLTFHEEPKLRTVLWGWAGEPVDEQLLAGVRLLAAHADGRLGKVAERLTRREFRALLDRTQALLQRAVFPDPGGGWPSLPWPAM